MTHALFDDAGKFLAGRVLSEADASMQIELDSGKRVKVKSANVLLRFDKPAPAELMAKAQALAVEIDLDLAWEFAPEGEFGFAEFARDYFDAKAGPEQQVASLLRLFEAPHYFRRAGKGQFKKAPEDIVKAALLAIERKKQVLVQIETWAAALVAGQCPEPVREQLYKILFKPDKMAPEYKAVVEAAKRSQRPPLDLLKGAGAIDSAYQFHWRRFLFEQFPKGVAFPALAAPAIKDDLPLAAVQAFSIDDSQTTEIDDALSVTGLGTGTVVFGVHIAAPALAIQPDSVIDKAARERLSTVYMPGWKLTMLPDAVVQAYTLIAGRDCPAVSLYVSFDEATLEVRDTQTRLERVPIAANLRHDQLDEVVTEAALTAGATVDTTAGTTAGTASDPSTATATESAPPAYPFAPELAFCFRLARHLKAGRELLRGKPENFNRPDYNFKLVRDDAQAAQAPDGSETVAISERRRGAPLDLIVSEAMILANSHWGGWLAEHGVPGIYRSQASMAPGIKVRMGVRPAPHAGMGVKQYTWATSPLRRYVDLVNQWQIVACAKHGRTAALAAPFKPRDAMLFSVISSFDAAYGAYNDFQNGIERFWALRWLQQQAITELDAAVMRDGLVRADAVPLVFKALGCENLPRGAKVRLRITGMDTLTLELHANLLARLDVAPIGELADSMADATADAGQDDGGDDDLAIASPLALAIDMADAEAAPEAPGPAAASMPPATQPAA